MSDERSVVKLHGERAPLIGCEPMTPVAWSGSGPTGPVPRPSGAAADRRTVTVTVTRAASLSARLARRWVRPRRRVPGL
jgi:hypothetical protein